MDFCKFGQTSCDDKGAYIKCIEGGCDCRDTKTELNPLGIVVIILALLTVCMFFIWFNHG